MLTQSLRDLEDAMLVERHNLETVPPHVEYSLTERGKTLIPILKQIHAWGDDQMALVVEKAKSYKNDNYILGILKNRAKMTVYVIFGPVGHRAPS